MVRFLIIFSRLDHSDPVQSTNSLSYSVSLDKITTLYLNNSSCDAVPIPIPIFTCDHYFYICDHSKHYYLCICDHSVVILTFMYSLCAPIHACPVSCVQFLYQDCFHTGNKLFRPSLGTGTCLPMFNSVCSYDVIQCAVVGLRA